MVKVFNVNRSPDRRFKENYEISVEVYGGINLSTDTGLNEEYHLVILNILNNFL